jgi:putative NADH-flavin reductase
MVVVGATGRAGHRVLTHALAARHAVRVLVRSPEKLVAQLGGALPDNLNVRAGDAEDLDTLAAALAGQEAAVQCALTPSYGERFVALDTAFTRLAEKILVGSRRVWVFGGVGALDVPGTGLFALDLMRPIFELHRRNWETLRTSSLDWSFACPGFMSPDPAAPIVHTSVDAIPIEPPAPILGDSAALRHWFADAFRFLTVSYDDVARVILDNLGADGPLSRHRVGFVLPDRQKAANDRSRGGGLGGGR